MCYRMDAMQYTNRVLRPYEQRKTDRRVRRSRWIKMTHTPDIIKESLFRLSLIKLVKTLVSFDFIHALVREFTEYKTVKVGLVGLHLFQDTYTLLQKFVYLEFDEIVWVLVRDVNCGWWFPVLIVFDQSG